MSRRDTLLIAAVGLALAAAGVTQYTDGIVRYVSRIVDAISWWDLWRPVFDPPPMNTHTYRPLTTALVKLELLLTGRDPMWMTALHGLSIPWLGFAAHRFCRRHGFGQVALPTALSTMLLPSMLFAGWIPVESDGIGAAFVCEAAAALQAWRLGPSRRRLIILVLFSFGAATTKETSAAALFGYFLAAAIAWRRHPNGQGRRLLTVLLSYGAGLTLLVWPLLLASSQKPHAFNVASHGFDLSRAGWMIGHNLAQLFYLTSSAGAALVLLYRLLPPGASRRRTAITLSLTLTALLLAPPMRVYNHYESVIIDRFDYVAAAALILLAALSWMALETFRKAQSPPPERAAAAGTALFLFGVLAVAPVLILQSRPDVSARLYAPIVPIIHGFAWAAALRLFRQSAGLWRPITAVIGLSFALFPPSAASNGIQFHRARMAVERLAKAALADRLKQPHVTCPIVISTNRDNELAVEELQAFGVPWSACSELFVPNQIHLDPSDADLDSWRVQGHRYSLLPAGHDAMARALLSGRAPERCAYLYVQTPKAMMETHDFRRFAGHFAWAFGKLPEFDEGVYAQQVEIQYREELGYQKLFKRAGAVEIAVEAPFDLFPLNPNEALTRLFLGLPIIEAYGYEGRLLYLEKCISAEK